MVQHVEGGLDDIHAEAGDKAAGQGNVCFDEQGLDMKNIGTNRGA